MNKIHNIILLILSVLFSLFLIEIVLRIFNFQPTYAFEKGLFVEDSRYGYRFAPLVTKFHSQPEFYYTITSNSLGFIGEEPDYKAKYKVLVLGDSVGMGQGMVREKSFCGRAQSYFKTQRSDVDIFNTCISGYSSINELNVLKQQIIDYKPNLVLLIFCWGKIGLEHSLAVQDGYLVLRKDNSFKTCLEEWLNNNSRLFCLIKRLYYIKKASSAVINGYSQQAIDSTLGFIKNMKDICDKNHADFMVVLTPDLHIQNSSFTKNYLIDQLKKNSIPYEDWLLLLPEKGKQSFFFKHDPHLNQKGNQYFSGPFIKLIEDEFKSYSQ